MKIIAHRANLDHSPYPENTLEAVETAWKAPVDGVEIDINHSIDNHVVVFHDEKTGRLTNKSLIIRKEYLHNLNQLDIGNKFKNYSYGYKMPLLADVLKTHPKNKHLLIELKKRCKPDIIDTISKILDEQKPDPRNLAFIGFKKDMMSIIKKQFPIYNVYPLFSIKEFPSIISEAKKINADGVDLESSYLITKELVSNIKNEGLSVHVYLRRRLEKDFNLINSIMDFGVDSITTNIPFAVKGIFQTKNFSLI